MKEDIFMKGYLNIRDFSQKQTSIFVNYIKHSSMPQWKKISFFDGLNTGANMLINKAKNKALVAKLEANKW